MVFRRLSNKEFEVLESGGISYGRLVLVEEDTAEEDWWAFAPAMHAANNEATTYFMGSEAMHIVAARLEQLMTERAFTGTNKEPQ